MTKSRLQPVVVELPLEEGKTYKTKFQTGEYFRVEKIILRPNTDKIIRVDGIYLNHVDNGLCPLDPERLYPETKMQYKEILICECCGKDV